MVHICRSTGQRKTGQPCQTGRTSDGARHIPIDDRGKPVKPEGKHPHATPREKGAAADLYFDGRSYRRIAGNMDQHFGRETGSTGVYRWARELTEKADSVVKPMQVATGGVRVADEVVVKVGGKNHWRFNVMDDDTRFVLAAYLSPVRTTRAAATALALARETGQAYVDGLALHYNYFRPHESLMGKRPAEAAGAELPFKDWEDVAAMKSG